MNSIDADANALSRRQTELRHARRAIDGALSRDRGRLHGLWTRWSATPDSGKAKAVLEALIKQSHDRV